MTAVLDEPITSEDCECALCRRARGEDRDERPARPRPARGLWWGLIALVVVKSIECALEAVLGKTITAVLKSLVELFW